MLNETGLYDSYYYASINHLQSRIDTWRKEKGFESPTDIFAQPNEVLVKLALLTSEIGEAVESVRMKDGDNFKEELADIVIRVMDLSASLKINLAHEIAAKMVKNHGREYKHGKVC